MARGARGRYRGRVAGRAQLADGVVEVDGVPEGDAVQDESERAELVLHAVAVAVPELAFAAVERVHARLDLLETVNSAKALAMLNVGDRVRFSHRTRPQYLRGVEGVVVEWRRRRRGRARQAHRHRLRAPADRPVRQRPDPPVPTAAAGTPQPSRLTEGRSDQPSPPRRPRARQPDRGHHRRLPRRRRTTHCLRSSV